MTGDIRQITGEYYIRVTTEKGVTVEFEKLELKEQCLKKDGVTVDVSRGDGCFDLCVSCAGDRAKEIEHRYTTPLRNFNRVIIPDTGRDYPMYVQPVHFWGLQRATTVADIRTPLYIFCGQNNMTSFAFGVIGKDFERNFKCVEPFKARALSAFTRRLTVSVEELIPEEYRSEDFCEKLFIFDTDGEGDKTWFDTLRNFFDIRKRWLDTKLPYVKKSMLPLWCSWTDWFSDDVTDEVILENAKAGKELGVYNYIIDDGWFGPGLDNDYDVDLNIGDWTEDTAKIRDLKALNKELTDMGVNPVMWMAPHAVAPKAKCHGEREKYLVKKADGSLVLTYNRFNVLCLRSPEAREIMAEQAVRMINEYGAAGAKYDLFNCIPADEYCCSCEHTHDTDSTVVGLERTMKLIYEKVTKAKKDYIVELKQNYGGSTLASYGTMMRAGDTPYCPDGNFIRTAYIAAYTPYAINDYQTICNNDTPLSNSRVIIKMIAVGVPSYSMDITTLSDENKKVLGFLNGWYIENIVERENYTRTPLTAFFDSWVVDSKGEKLYILIDFPQKLTVPMGKFQLLNGACKPVDIACEESALFDIEYYNIFGELIETKTVNLKDGITLDSSVALIKAKPKE